MWTDMVPVNTVVVVNIKYLYINTYLMTGRKHHSDDGHQRPFSPSKSFPLTMTINRKLETIQLSHERTKNWKKRAFVGGLSRVSRRRVRHGDRVDVSAGFLPFPRISLPLPYHNNQLRHRKRYKQARMGLIVIFLASALSFLAAAPWPDGDRGRGWVFLSIKVFST